MRSTSRPATTFTALCRLAAVFIFCVSGVHAQDDQTPKRGFQPGGSYALSDIETVNTTNGNLILNVPLAALPAGRGTMPGATLRLLYNSKLYDSRAEQHVGPGGPSGQTCIGPDGTPMPCDQSRLRAGDERRVVNADWGGGHRFLAAQNNNSYAYAMNLLQPSDAGGWHYGLRYSLNLYSRFDQYADGYVPPCASDEYVYHWKLKMTFPDGSEHEFRPVNYGQSLTLNDGYYAVEPNGLSADYNCVSHWASTSGMTYYSTDGTYARLFVAHDNDPYWWNNAWTLSLPDGTRVTGGNAPQRVYDRNNNYVEIQEVLLANGHSATKVVDQLGRHFLVEYGAAPGEDHVISYGMEGHELRTRIRWKTVWVYRAYTATLDTPLPQGVSTQRELFVSHPVVDQIILPAQAGGLAYTFTYAASDAQPAPGAYTAGWGELNSVTLPTGAQAAYRYVLDGPQTGASLWGDVLQNYAARKELTYQKEYEDDAGVAAETWQYSISSTASIVTGPDGGVSTEYFKDTQSPTQGFDAGLVYKSVRPDGTIVERLWRRNVPAGAAADNPYVKTEFTTVADAAGNPAQTAVKDYDYDKNGNVTRVREYDWVPYASVPRDAGGRPSGIPSGAPLKRETTNAYYNQTPDAADWSTASGYTYVYASAPALRGAPAATQVGDGTGVLSRTEYVYDDPSARGNLTLQRSWDSTKGSLLGSPQDPVRLDDSNSIGVRREYDDNIADPALRFGNLTLTVGPRGNRTKYTYGAVTAPGGTTFNGLYPTTVEAAEGTSVWRTTSSVYDFWTGLVRRSTDVDNEASTTTDYDDLGRPTLVRAAEGLPAETCTATEYYDAARRVVVRADKEKACDGQLVTVQHYDRLGRVRLTRTLEDAATQSAADESAGLKVQTRYAYGAQGSYRLVSNPYRAAAAAGAGAEGSMGWTVTTADRGGRLVRVETFGGAGLPAPFAAGNPNSSSTGAVVSAYDAEKVTVTDQAGRRRRSVSDALGRLVRVDEPDKSTGALDDSVGSPVQPTFYAYDAPGNLRRVDQGGQQRFFLYDSLGRLIRAKNPEQGSMAADADFPSLADAAFGNPGGQWSAGYLYDAAGNLRKRKDARGVTTTYGYDALNRNTTVHHDDAVLGAANHTPDVTRSYDGATRGKGRLWKTETAQTVLVTVEEYDAVGRPLRQGQQFCAGTACGAAYNVGYSYYPAGGLKTKTYPSNHSVSYTYDGAGRLSGFAGNLGGAPRTYADSFAYDAAGRVRQERYGTDTPVYNKHLFNSRGQLAEIRVSTYGLTAAGQETNWNRGAIINHYSASGWGATGGGPDNNGNLRAQDVFIPKFDGAGYDQGGNYDVFSQGFDYDALNRLTQARELSGGQTRWAQVYDYDRWGNRTINAAATQVFDPNPLYAIPEPQFVADANTNRLGVPTGQAGQMGYDAAGNLTYDSYQGGQGGGGTRTYDAENRMTSAQFFSGQAQAASYVYDADGRRIKRGVGTGEEAWQVYGAGGELLAEYAPGASPSQPRKEYGYRGGELLVTAEPGGGQAGGAAGPANAAADFLPAQNPAGVWSYGYRPAGGNFTPYAGNSNVFGAGTSSWSQPSLSWCCPSVTHNDTGATLTYQNNPNVVQPADTLNLHPGTGGERSVVRWTAPAAGTYTVAGRFQGIDVGAGTTTDVAVTKGAATLFAAQVNGAGASAPFTLTLSAAAGDAVEFSVGVGANGTYNSDSTGLAVTVTPQGSASAAGDFSAAQNPSGEWAYGYRPAGGSFAAFTSNDNIFGAGADSWSQPAISWCCPFVTRNSTGATLTYQNSPNVVQPADVLNLHPGPNGERAVVRWTAPSAGSYTVGGRFQGLDAGAGTTTDVAVTKGGATLFGGQVNGYGSQAPFSLTVSVAAGEAVEFSVGVGSNGTYNSDSTGLEATITPQGAQAAGADVRWLVTDQLGTPRMVVDRTGSLAGVTRHDYLPFGEELTAGAGGRTITQGYGAADNVRQKFTGHERDDETGLDFAQARMYANRMGRFTSADPVLMSKDRVLDPQGINLYTYCANNPLIHTDPDGKYFVGTDGKRVQVSLQKDRIVVGRNASADLRRIVNLTNVSQSKTAVSSLLDTANSATRVNYRISKGEGVYTDPVTGKQSTPLYGLTQPHDKAGKPLGWSDALKGFAGTPEYIKDGKGNLVYKEATITIYEGSLKGKGLTMFGSGYVVNDPNVTTNEALVISTAHEETHVTGQEGIDNIRNHNTENVETTVEAVPKSVHNQVDQEIQQHRNRSRP